MRKFEFEIQNIINIKVSANSKEEARAFVINCLEDGEYDDDLKSDCCISDGEETK